jgi:hypothetical protein
MPKVLRRSFPEGNATQSIPEGNLMPQDFFRQFPLGNGVPKVADRGFILGDVGILP